MIPQQERAQYMLHNDVTSANHLQRMVMVEIVHRSTSRGRANQGRYEGESESDEGCQCHTLGSLRVNFKLKFRIKFGLYRGLVLRLLRPSESATLCTY